MDRRGFFGVVAALVVAPKVLLEGVKDTSKQKKFSGHRPTWILFDDVDAPAPIFTEKQLNEFYGRTYGEHEVGKGWRVKSTFHTDPSGRVRNA